MKTDRKDMQGKKLLHRLRGSRGVAMFELAILLPLLLTLIAGVVEVPRVFVVKNRTVNAARVVADIRSRNDSDMVPINQASGTALHKKVSGFLGNQGKYAGNKITLLGLGSKRLSVSGLMNRITNNKGVRIIGSIVTFNEYTRLFSNVMDQDYLVSGKCAWEMSSILPGGFLRATIGEKWSSGKLNIQSPVCYMPNRNAYVKTQSRKFSTYTDKLYEEIKILESVRPDTKGK